MPRDGVGKMLVRRFETWETRTFRNYGMKDGNYPVPCISGTVFKKKKKNMEDGNMGRSTGSRRENPSFEFRGNRIGSL